MSLAFRGRPSHGEIPGKRPGMRHREKPILRPDHTLQISGRRLTGLRTAPLPAGGVHFLVSFFGLRGTLFRHPAECLWGVRLWETGGLRSCGLGVHVHEVLIVRAFSVDDPRTRRPER